MDAPRHRAARAIINTPAERPCRDRALHITNQPPRSGIDRDRGVRRELDEAGARWVVRAEYRMIQFGRRKRIVATPRRARLARGRGACPAPGGEGGERWVMQLGDPDRV